MIKPISTPTHTNYLVSVIIPAFNACNRLLLLLESLRNQSVKDFEVIVVDDGSTDGTREAVEALIKGYPVSLRYYYLDNTDIFGAGIARNYGAKRSAGDILLFLDQDTVAEENLIKNHRGHHKTKDIILGYYAGYGDEKKRYHLSELRDYVQHNKPIPTINEFRDRLFMSASRDDGWKCFVSAHFSIKKTIFEKYCFDESFIQWGCEDIDLGYRLFQAGEAIHFVKECVVYNSSRSARRTKKKFRTLLESLIQMHNKYRTEGLKLYCFERFYHTPIQYRGSLQLMFNNKEFEVRESQTKIAINKNCQARAVLGSDFKDVASTIESIIPLMKSIHFDASIIKTLKEPLLSDFRNMFGRLAEMFRDKKIRVNFEGRGKVA